MPKVVGVCHGPVCADYGGRDMATALREQGMDVKVLACQSLCPHAPVARIAGIAILRARCERVMHALAE